MQLTSITQVQKVKVRENGVIILTGPSSCGKGEVAAALCRVLGIDPEIHLSMGEILRGSFSRAKNEPHYANLLESKYQISQKTNIFNCIDTTDELSRKVYNYQEEFERYFNKKMGSFVSQLEWLEFCTMNGLLVPNRWTQNFIAAHIESSPKIKHSAFILDGYPRTVAAAKHLLEFLSTVSIPVIKVVHLHISKQEMIARAKQRARADDDENSLSSRFQFYVESVQPSVDYMKVALGSEAIALVDAHQPVFDPSPMGNIFNLQASINNVVSSVLRSLGVPRVIIKDLLDPNNPRPL